jgi:hypothetical protein
MQSNQRIDKGMRRIQDADTGETIRVDAPITYYDDFLGKACDLTNDWTVAGVNSGNAIISVLKNGVVQISTGNADDDDVDMALGLVLTAAQGIGMEARIAITDVDKTCLNVGFTDATGEAADLIPAMFAVATATITADNCALLVADADATSYVVRGICANATVAGTIVTSTVVPADTIYHIYRVEIDSLGNVEFYIDGVYIGATALGILTTAALCPYIGVINHGEAAVNTTNVDYVRVWASLRG